MNYTSAFIMFGHFPALGRRERATRGLTIMTDLGTDQKKSQCRGAIFVSSLSHRDADPSV